MKDTFRALPVSRKTALIAAAASVISVFLPWVSLLGISVSGVNTGDGKIVLVVAGIALVLLAVDAGLVSWFNVSRRLVSVASLVAAALCLLIAIVDMNEFAAIGLYVLLLASIAWSVAAVQSLRNKPADAAQAATASEPPASTDG